MNKLILADSQAIFRAGTAKVLAMNEELRIIAQCTDLDRMYHAITTFPGSIVLFAASMRPDLTRLRMLLETMGSRGVVIAENNEPASAYLQQGFRGVVFRNVTGPSMVECVHRVVVNPGHSTTDIPRVRFQYLELDLLLAHAFITFRQL